MFVLRPACMGIEGLCRLAGTNTSSCRLASLEGSATDIDANFRTWDSERQDFAVHIMDWRSVSRFFSWKCARKTSKFVGKKLAASSVKLRFLLLFWSYQLSFTFLKNDFEIKKVECATFFRFSLHDGSKCATFAQHHKIWTRWLCVCVEFNKVWHSPFIVLFLCLSQFPIPARNNSWSFRRSRYPLIKQEQTLFNDLRHWQDI